MTIKKAVRKILPPIVVDGLLKLRNLMVDKDKLPLFEGDDAMFKNIVSRASVYVEYGCGRSTIWVAKNTRAQIYYVDTSKEWIDFVTKQVGGRELNPFWIDCGEIGKWGQPLSYEKRMNFMDYAEMPWRQNSTPEVVLVDGRFRVLCFLVSLKNARAGTKIIFDDYVRRKHYHVVEDFVKREQVCGQQCLFVVPPKDQLDMNKLSEMIGKFEYVLA